MRKSIRRTHRFLTRNPVGIIVGSHLIDKVPDEILFSETEIVVKSNFNGMLHLYDEDDFASAISWNELKMNAQLRSSLNIPDAEMLPYSSATEDEQLGLDSIEQVL